MNKDNRPAGFKNYYNLRDVFTCVRVYLLYNCDVQCGQRLAWMEIVVKQ